ncbi:MAG TPA: hypothetical protein VIF62_26895, partial [Labilithrix sp.]
RYSAIRIYFGTWSLTDGTPKARLGPIAPDRGAAKAMQGSLIGTYFERLARGDAAIVDCFEPDGYFREPANNYACGRDQLEAHFSNILKLGGVGVELLTATCDKETFAFEVQTITWGTKRMPAPQAGFASYDLGRHGKVAGARVYDSVVPPEL